MSKAYTARTFRSPSGALVERLKADPTLGLIHLTNVIANQGALPIKVGDEVIGAAGASGAPGGTKRASRPGSTKWPINSSELYCLTALADWVIK
jgi:uncharacterized protein GlcG (DUF336 family)